ncbi:L-threonylcarbamoyladenylate synthase [Sulfuriflexus sp.]|uniref:L-threonylcarbamoyladenylate synthase n=1 Tax=Sulfuriflexus sp. TaxID=2015443 RepID=UPI0028CD8A9A|nr:L-threonylcarbamoyladenylate synthase [Sulfuriflexus sp.]MDT8403732.1 L-threonylcarbamoyladenylate synthase [Sulfuriflexus sp.]
MSQFFEIHPDNPQRRLIHQAVEIIRQGGVIVYPTDSSYALGCQIDDKAALERLARIRQVSKRHDFTLLCRDLSEISTYAKVDNKAYRLMKSLTPGPYTFIFKATREVPKRLWNPKRKSIGIRVPDNAIVQALLADLNEPLMSSTLILPDEDRPLNDASAIREILEHHVDLVIDGGPCSVEPTTVLDLSEGDVQIRRQGLGPTDAVT